MLLCLMVGWPLMAQEKQDQYDPSQQKLKFAYIAHDENTAIQSLIPRLNQMVEDATYMPERVAVILYLPNGEEPMVIRINTGVNDNPQDYPRMVDELQNRLSHDGISLLDCEKIIEIFDTVPLLNEDGTPHFKAVDWNYYVNASFWKLNMNESVIASLYWIMDMEQLLKDYYLNVNIYYGEQAPKLPINEELPFGEKKLNATMPLQLMPY